MIWCTDANQYRKVTFFVRGNGSYRTPAVPIYKPGWYSWTTHIPSTTLATPMTAGCREPSETVLVARRSVVVIPEIPTGYKGFAVRTASMDRTTPAAVVVAAAGGREGLDGLSVIGKLIDSLSTLTDVIGHRGASDTDDGDENSDIRPGVPGDLPLVTRAQAQGLVSKSGDELITSPQVAAVPHHTKGLYSPPNGTGVTKMKGTIMRIVSIGAYAPVDTVGVTGSVLSVPSSVSRVGWFNQTAHLDDAIGSTVLAGHVSDNSDRPGALYKLTSLHNGEVITVTKGGQTYRFAVSSIRTYDRTGQLPAAVFSTTGAHHLTIVSCTGKVTYPNGSFHYTKNIVVTAKALKT